MISLPRFLPLFGWLFALSAFAGDAGIRPGAEALHNWPQWRGPLANGVASLADPPIHWSKTNDVRLGNSAPGQVTFLADVFGDPDSGRRLALEGSLRVMRQ
ncbi:MAG TPA: hypothetical protein VJ063_21060 [Verrucomicrobiae bacterium]|nr:hypothetical protein [Verrucomicrobiae bacterium]